MMVWRLERSLAEQDDTGSGPALSKCFALFSGIRLQEKSLKLFRRKLLGVSALSCDAWGANEHNLGQIMCLMGTIPLDSLATL